MSKAARSICDLASMQLASAHGVVLGQRGRCAVSKLPGGWRGIHRANWATGPTFTDEPAIVPSAWEKMLRDMHINEAQALELLKERKCDKARRIRVFVDRNKHKAFVPETVLIRLGEATW